VKWITLSFFLVFLQLSSSARPDSLCAFIEAGPAWGTINYGHLSLNFIYKRNELSFGYTGGSRQAEVPPDFIRPWGILGPPGPYEVLKLYSISYGRVYSLRGRPLSRVILRGAFIYGTYGFPDEFVPKEPDNNGFFGPSNNYDYINKEVALIGIKINPVMQLPARYIGISAGPYIMITNYKTFAGFQAGVLLGAVRQKIRRGS
jgi:hypothetical protein